MVLKVFPDVVTKGQQYNIEEKPTVILHTKVHHHVGASTQNQGGTKTKTRNNLDQVYNIFGLRVPDYGTVI